MKVDVIIPTHNRALLVERAIKSVLSQTHQQFHLYVVDDGSTDETPQLLQKYRNHSQITLLTQPNAGVSSARNLGARVSSSDWISFLDSDDEWLPQKLESQLKALKTNPAWRFLHAEEIWMRKGVRVNPKVKHSKSGPDLFTRSLEFCLISPSTVVMRKDLFHQHHGFNEEMVVCEDFDLWNKILATEEVGFLDAFVTVKYGGHEDQLSTKFVAMDHWRIQSLLNLSRQNYLSEAQRVLVNEVVKKKSVLLLKGYLKHQNFEKHAELLKLVAHLNFES